jgi:hypothetical protein
LAHSFIIGVKCGRNGVIEPECFWDAKVVVKKEGLAYRGRGAAKAQYAQVNR